MLSQFVYKYIHVLLYNLLSDISFEIHFNICCFQLFFYNTHYRTKQIFKIALLTDVNYTSWKKRPINTYGCRQIIRIKEIWITTKHKVNVVYFLNINTFKVSSRALQKVPWSCDCPLNVSTPDSRSESSNPTTLS